MDITNLFCQGKYLKLATQGEYGNEFSVNYLPWVEEFGSGSVGWLIKRSNDVDAYPLPSIESDYVSTIVLTETETQYAGMGLLEVFFVNDGHTDKRISKTLSFVVEPSLQDTSEAPAPWESYIDAVHEDAVAAETSASNAYASAAAAYNSAQDAETAKQDVLNALDPVEELALKGLGVAEGASDSLYDSTKVTETVIAKFVNGSAPNPSNPNAVATDLVPVHGNSIFEVVVNRPVSQEGAYYTFGYALYDENKTLLTGIDWTTSPNRNKIFMPSVNAKYIAYTIACYTAGVEYIPLRKEDFSYGDVVVIEKSLDTLADKIPVMDESLLHNMHVRFQGGYWQADGSYAQGGNSIECMLPYIEREAEFIKLIGGNYFVVFLYSGNTYLGKINENFVLDMVSGGSHFMKFTGTMNIAAVMKHFNADGFTITVNCSTTEYKMTSYYYMHSEELCQFYSYKDQTEPYIEEIPMTRGTWSGSNLESFYCNRTQTRMRPYFLIPVKVGDMIYFDCDNGKYVHALGYWANGLPGIGSKKWDDGTSRAGDEYVRFAFDGYVMASFSLASNTSAIIDPDTFTGSMTLIRNSQRHDMQNLNDQALRDAMGAQRNFSNTATNNTPYKNLPTFVHVTDVHGDAPSFGNAYDVAKLLKADAFVATGDMVYYYATDPVDYIADTVSDKKVDFLMCMGNHDGFLLDREGQYTKYIEPFATAYGYQLDQNATNPTYYYKDYSNKNLRVIVVNQFEYDGKESSTDTRPCYTQAQMDFIVNALLTTPQDYGVIIAMHSPEKTPSKDSTYDKFFQRKFLYTGYGTSIHPLADIVDAFISKTTLSQTYNNPSGATPSSVTVTADFSNVNSGVEFIAYICGHYHSDAVSYVSSTTNKQLLLNATTTNSWTNMKKVGVGSNTLYVDNPYLAELCDLQRMSGTPSQDAFNVYVIDRANKAVKVIRVGSNRTDTMDIRDYMVIPYAD